MARLPRVQPNDNRRAGGTQRGDTLAITLVVGMAEWRPEADSGPSIVVAAFAEDSAVPQVPGPLIRVKTGTIIAATVRNALVDSTIEVIGLVTHPALTRDSLRLRPGETKSVTFQAGAPGTYLYRAVLGKHDDDKDDEREQVAGALIVDPPGVRVADRVFVMNIWGRQIDSVSYSNALTINGRSWPYTERLNAYVSDTVHWRVVNATTRSHPMHLHGAFFRVEQTGDAFGDSANGIRRSRLVVTEMMEPMETMDMSWTPVNEGRWLFHCHIAFHVIPSAARLTPLVHGSHDGASENSDEHMAGLVLGIDATLRPGAHTARRGAARKLDLFVQERSRRGRSPRSMGFVLQRGMKPPAPDSVEIPGTPLVLTRGEPIDVTVHNRLRETTSIHWHGLELESGSDGVPGWSGNGAQMAHSIAPGATFVAHLSVPRAGTFLYHTHLNDLVQLTSGLYGGLVVLEPGQRFNPRTDHLFVAGWDGPEDPAHVLVNGDSVFSPPLQARVGEEHRLRFVNIGAASRWRFSLQKDSLPVKWTLAAKDGAELPRNERESSPASVVIDVGETYDFLFRARSPGVYVLSLAHPRKGTVSWTQRIVVSP